MRGLDDHWISSGRAAFAYQGVALFDVRGAGNVKSVAKTLSRLAYSVAVWPTRTTRNNSRRRMPGRLRTPV